MTSVATKKRIATNSSAEASSRARLTSTKVEPQMSVLKASAKSARHAAGCGSAVKPGLRSSRTQRKQNAFQGEVAALWQKPLVRGMRLATLAACADRNGGDVERQRDIGVGRCAIETGADSQVSVDRTQIGQDGRAPSASLPAGRAPISFSFEA